MSILRLLAIALGAACLGALSDPSFAKATDGRPSFTRPLKAQSLNTRRQKPRRQFFLFAPRKQELTPQKRDNKSVDKAPKRRLTFARVEPQLRTTVNPQLRKRRFTFFSGSQRRVAVKPQLRKRRLTFAGADPQPSRPKSPDAGFEIYRPVQLVALRKPDLGSQVVPGVMAAAVLQEFREPKSPLMVTEQQRDAIVDFYLTNNFRPLWVGLEGLNDKARRTLALLADAEREGLNPSDYVPPSLGSSVDDASALKGNVGSLARLDIGVTAMALRYAEHIYSGRIVPKRLSGYYDIVPPVLNLGQVLIQLSARTDPDRYLSSLAPTHPAYSAMKASLAAFEKESVQREQEPIPAGERVKPGGQDARVSLVRARMVELGYLPEDDAAMIAEPAAYSLQTGKGEATLDEPLSKALKVFQANHGIKQTGSIDKATVAALNSRPERGNAEKLVLNMERLRWLPRDLGKRHVFVNQASFELRLIDGGDITWSTKVIVGTPDTQTAVFSDQMETVVINPYWGVPQSIIRHEMMPRLARDRRYLDRLGYQVVNERGRLVSSRSVNWWAYKGVIPFGVRQPPGDGNALGRVKFLFPNSHDIYMHDTPAKELFAEPVRAFSHGCVRVESPRELAEHVLDWERERIDDMIATGQNQDIKLSRHIPVHLNYFTAWPDESGKIVFHSDIYNRDTRLDKALNTVALASN